MRRLREVGLEDCASKPPNELSGGMRKRAGFARALVLDPDIVLFDEPDSGLDPVRTALLCELIQEIHDENGGAYVVITHDIMFGQARLAEYIAVLWQGKIVESGPADELFDSENHFVRQFLGAGAGSPRGWSDDRSRRSRAGARRRRRARGGAAARQRRDASVQAALPDGRAARQGQRRAGRRAADRDGRRDRADRRQPGRGDRRRRGALRAAARGHAGDDQADVAERCREPVRRADARARQRSRDPRRGDAGGRDDKRGRPRPAVQHARRTGAARPAEARAGVRDAVRRRRAAGERGGALLQPGAVEHRPAAARAERGRGRADPVRSQLDARR